MADTLLTPDPNDYSERYNTPLSEDEEKRFRKWAKEQKRERDVYDYDLRGFWKEGNAFAENGHGSDRFKKPNHPTFSTESRYHGADGYYGGQWEERDGRVMFTPSEHNLRNMPLEVLLEYFRKVEPDVLLNVPPANRLYPRQP